MGFGVFSLPASRSPQAKHDADPLSLTLTTGTLETLAIPTNDDLTAYPFHENPILVLKALLSLSSHQTVSNFNLF
jgi:hypothetical protein